MNATVRELVRKWRVAVDVANEAELRQRTWQGDLAWAKKYRPGRVAEFEGLLVKAQRDVDNSTAAREAAFAALSAEVGSDAAAGTAIGEYLLGSR